MGPEEMCIRDRDASEYFTVTARFHSPQEMEAAFRKNKIDVAIVFGERFADGLYKGDARVQLIADATDPNMSTSQTNYAASIVSSVGQEMLPSNVSVSRLIPDIKLLYNPQMKSAYNLSLIHISCPSFFKRLNLLIDIFNQIIVFLYRRMKDCRKKLQILLHRKILIKRESSGHIPYFRANQLVIRHHIQSVDNRRAFISQQ